jgi:hypothetical protein
VKERWTSYGGPIWDMALQNEMLAVSCEDGTVRLFSAKNDSLAYIR